MALIQAHASPAIRRCVITAAFGDSPESSMQMQAAYDLCHAAKKRRLNLQPLKLAA
jgi:plasmid maintenance system antidote protein VapI